MPHLTSPRTQLSLAYFETTKFLDFSDISQLLFPVKVPKRRLHVPPLQPHLWFLNNPLLRGLSEVSRSPTISITFVKAGVARTPLRLSPTATYPIILLGE